MLTIRRSQLALLGSAMLDRFIDDETERVAVALAVPPDVALRERVRDAVMSARVDGLHPVDAVRRRIEEGLGLGPQAAAG